MRKKVTLALVISGLLAAQTGQAADLMTVFRLAEQRDPTYAETQATYRAAIEDGVQARAKLWLPTAGVTASVGHNRQDGDFEIGADREDIANSQAGAPDETGVTYFTNSQFSLEIAQPIYHYDRFIAVDQMETRIKGALNQVSAAHQKLLLRVAERYFEVLAATDNLSFARAEEAALGSQLHQIQRRFDLGTIPITDLQEAQANYDLAAARIIEAQNQVSVNRAQLREVIDEDIEVLTPLGDEIPIALPKPGTLAPWVETALKQNLEIVAANYTTREANDEIKRQSADHLPTLDMRVSQGYQDTGGRIGANSVDTGVSLTLNIPIYEGGQVVSRTRQAQYRHQASLDRLEQQRRSVRQQTEASFLGVLSSVKRIKALAQAVTSNTTAAQATRRGFEVGTRTAIDVVLAERNLARARSDHARARYDYILNTLRLKQAAGTLSPQDLAQMNGWLVPQRSTSGPPSPVDSLAQTR